MIKATGLEGQLIGIGDGSYRFRVYAKDGSFVDCALAHSDLTITINDEDAFIYEYGDLWVLDHSPETRGVTGESE
jgi:hypothetical protein